MKRIFLTLFSVVCTMALCHAATGYKSVVINKMDNTTMSIAMEGDMTTSIANGELNLSCAKGDITMMISDVRNWTFSTKSGASDLWAGIELPIGDEVTCIMESDRILIENLPQNSVVALYTIDGRTISSATVGGNYELSLVGLQHGVYVLTYNNKSLKIAVAK